MEQAIDFLLKVLIYTAAAATPLIALMALLYIWDVVKKKMNKEKKEPERIIVKMKKEEGDKEFTETTVIEPETTEPVDYSKLTLKELKKLPEVKAIRGFSRMPKAEILSRLQ